MYAENCKLGQKFKHKNCGIVVIIEEDGIKYFENENGDLFSYIDEDLLLHEI